MLSMRPIRTSAATSPRCCSCNATWRASLPQSLSFIRPAPFGTIPGGTSLILSRLLRNSFQSERDYLRFPRERLFDPLAMRSAVIEADNSGTLVAASFMYASARYWARLGLLFQQGGMWQGRRLLPEDWVAYTLTPASAAPDERYGGHMWLKIPEARDLGEPPMLEESYYMLGYDQQVVAVIPSRDLVLVRLGLSHDADSTELARNLAAIVRAFPAKRPE